MTNEELVNIAHEAMKQAYAPYSNFKVGAALLMSDSAVYKGCNIENASYGLSMCAERVAVFKAIADGRKNFEKLAIICETEDYCSPCGACRQVLTEFAEDMPIIMANSNKEYVVMTVKELIPGFFNREHLHRRSTNG